MKKTSINNLALIPVRHTPFEVTDTGVNERLTTDVGSFLPGRQNYHKPAVRKSVWSHGVDYWISDEQIACSRKLNEHLLLTNRRTAERLGFTRCKKCWP